MRHFLIALALTLPWAGCDTQPDEPTAQRVMEEQTYLPPEDTTQVHEQRTIFVQAQVQQPAAQARNANALKAEGQSVDRAIAVMIPVGDTKVHGVITFQKVDKGVEVSGELRNLTPGKHGFHVHEFGDLSDLDKGESAGGHFNPDGHEHGKREADMRHAGDFGNIEANADGVASIKFVDSKIQLTGVMSIIGRGVVVHAGEDKFTQPSGDAGGRVSLGVIGIAKTEKIEK